MAQDLGLHRYVDKWQRSGMRLFTQDEMQLRRRIWHTCIVMDRYVSTYIGRPLAIDEREFDTPLPTEIEQEENELWENHPSLFEQELRPLWNKDEYRPIASRSISTFNAAASLASIVGLIVQSLYSVKHGVASPAATANELEKKLDMWWIELPDHLRYDPSIKRLPIPPPNILTLHMNHWTAVLLLHRPFINMKPVDGSEDPVSAKAWDLCVSAASHISTLVGVYRENFCLKRCAPFLSYYIFSAGIMHVTTRMSYFVGLACIVADWTFLQSRSTRKTYRRTLVCSSAWTHSSTWTSSGPALAVPGSFLTEPTSRSEPQSLRRSRTPNVPSVRPPPISWTPTMGTRRPRRRCRGFLRLFRSRQQPFSHRLCSL